MSDTNEMTCAACGGTWGKPWLVGSRESYRNWNTCPADCHDKAKWEALAELERTNRENALVIRIKNDRIAELEKEKDRE